MGKCVRREERKTQKCPTISAPLTITSRAGGAASPEERVPRGEGGDNRYADPSGTQSSPGPARRGVAGQGKTKNVFLGCSGEHAAAAANYQDDLSAAAIEGIIPPHLLCTVVNGPPLLLGALRGSLVSSRSPSIIAWPTASSAESSSSSASHLRRHTAPSPLLTPTLLRLWEGARKPPQVGAPRDAAEPRQRRRLAEQQARQMECASRHLCR